MLEASERFKLDVVKYECLEFMYFNITDRNCLDFKNIGDARKILPLTFKCLYHALLRFKLVYLLNNPL